MKGVIWEPPALAEFDDALARSDDPSEFQQDVEVAVSDIGSGLLAGGKIPRTRCRELVLTRLPYRIVYRESTDDIRIYAFAHHKRRTGYWKSRLDPPT